jgi:hypothetical protein
METVYAKDKYGHYIYASDGTKLTTTQPKYWISDSYVLNSNSYIDTSATNCKLKLVYRLQVGTYKAECEVTYLKNRDIDLDSDSHANSILGSSSYQKVDFIYNKD